MIRHLLAGATIALALMTCAYALDKCTDCTFAISCENNEAICLEYYEE